MGDSRIKLSVVFSRRQVWQRLTNFLQFLCDYSDFFTTDREASLARDHKDTIFQKCSGELWLL